MSDETYRMLGREHQADLERQAAAWRLASEARRNVQTATAPQPEQPRKRTGLLGLFVRFARASG
jgi:hypothetical protein